MHDIHGAKLDLNLLFAFDALLRERSVTAAAAQMGLTQSAMSHTLRRLRTFFDDPLFVKTADGMKPTPKAEMLAESVLSVMATVRGELLSQAQFDASVARREFRLCMTDMGELVFLPPLIETFRQLAPHCTLRTMQVPLERINETLENGEADLALGSLHSVPGGLFQQELFVHSFVTIVSAKNSTVDGRISLEQFCGMEHVVVTLSGNNEPYDRALDEAGLKRKIFLTTPHFLIVPLILEQNPQLIATVPRWLGTVFEKYGAIKVLKPPVELSRFPLRQHWHPRFHHDEANIWLRRLVKHTFRTDPPE